jgi:hypothetical protein
MLDLMYNVPSQRDIKQCVINEEVVQRRRSPSPLQEGRLRGPSPASEPRAPPNAPAVQADRRRTGEGMHPSFVGVERQTLPLVPLRDMVVFPHMMAPFIVGRESSVRGLEQTL